MDVVRRIVASGDLSGLATACESYELQCAESVHASADLPDPLYAIQLCAYLIENDLSRARFFWKRATAAKKCGEFAAMWVVAQHLWRKDYALAQRGLVQGSWSAELSPLVVALQESVRGRTWALLAKAYTSLLLQNCAEALGLSPAQTITFCQQRGWVMDSTGKVLLPGGVKSEQARISGHQSIGPLTDYVVHLDC
eukprot:tig00021357_g20736.t1